MKIFKLAAIVGCLTTAIQSSAQYFHQLTGTGDPEVLTEGHNTSLLGFDGHFMVGPGPFAGSFNAVRTNASGSALPPAPYFKKRYDLSEGPYFPTYPFMTEVRSLELTDSAYGYGLAGGYLSSSFSSPIPWGVYYQVLTYDGNLNPLFGPGIGMAKAYTTFSKSYGDVHVQKVARSLRHPDSLYICGYVTEQISNVNRVFVLKIDKSGNLIWSHIYKADSIKGYATDIPYDIIEAPTLDTPSGTYPVIVVGQHQDYTGVQSDGFLMRIDYLTGSIINPVYIYGDSLTDEAITCIKPSANINVDRDADGFVMGGRTTDRNTDFWFLAIENDGTVTWANKFDYSNGMPTGNNDYCTDIIERYNTSNRYEYYLAGTTDNGVLGLKDMMVVKTDDRGSGIPGGQFTYGISNDDECLRIDQQQGNFGGLSLYGTSDYPSSPLGMKDYYLVKSYFNGVTACNYDVQDPAQFAGPDLKVDIFGSDTASFMEYDLFTFYSLNLNEYNVCYQDSVVGGSNRRIYQQQPASGSFEVFPNPAGAEDRVQIVFDATQEGEASVSISDMTGRNIYSYNMVAAKGNNVVSVDLGRLSMVKGVYSVTLVSVSGKETRRLIIR